MDCDIGAVAFAGFGEGAVEEDLNFGQVFQAVAHIDGIDEALGGAPGPQGV